jgi:damage-control phosphatase, subfamily I
MNSQCVICQLKSISRHLKQVKLEEKVRLTLIREFLYYLATVDQSVTNPEMAAELNRLIAQYHPEKQLYLHEKHEFNQYMLDRYSHWLNLAKHSLSPLFMAAKLAIAGNIIDFGPEHEFSVDETIEKVIHTDLAVDDSEQLFNDLNNADKVLYLGDNAGEIVMDKLFISLIKHKNLSYVTRGKPVLNDVVLADADFIGMKKVCKVIDNGTDIPSTVLNKCSESFLNEFNTADVIISKGQGNLEGLIQESKRNIYFLFTVKCQAIADVTNTQKGDFVLMHATRLPDCSQSPCL